MFCSQSGIYNFNLNHDDEDDDRITDDPSANLSDHRDDDFYKEPMFEKTLTPSDVGKLNRLVIPKQHAEKHFPLCGAGAGTGGDPGGEKGLLLGFEDESGKQWRFRYSYWNSSQSYVLTKGWSRFVKDKKLDAGDVVQFSRHRMDAHRLFIGSRRRNAATAEGGQTAAAAVNVSGWTRAVNSEHAYPSSSQGNGLCLPYQQPYCLHAGSTLQNQVESSSSGNSSKRCLRLFGVNLECDELEDESNTDNITTPGIGSQFPIISHGQASSYLHHYYSHSNASSHHHVEMNYTRDVNQMRYHQG